MQDGDELEFGAERLRALHGYRPDERIAIASVGGTGVGYFVWNEWNNLSLTNVIFAVLLIGVVGMLLDLMFAQLQKAVTYVE